MGKLSDLIKEKRDIIIPLIHFMFTFFWQGEIFKGFGNWEYFFSVARNEKVISAAGEQFIVYVLSLVFCFLIIFGFWKIVFSVLQKKYSKADCIILGMILVVGLLFGLIMYPDSFGLEIDNYTNFLMARRFQPTYWQSIYTGAFYGGCLMVLPHPIAVFLVQWTFFWAVVGYIYTGIGQLFGNSICKYVALLLFLLPESYYLSYNAYRNNYYTILLLLYIFQIYFAIKKNPVNIEIREIIMFSVYTAFMMVWRSEGVLIGAAGFVMFLLFILKVHKRNIKQMAVLILTLCIFFGLMGKLQKIGSEKYYGQDYMILNTTSVLYDIFNDPDANLSYAGAEKDMENIGAVIPTEVLKEYGMDGYRSYNWSNGRYDFNQTLATDEQASAYMASYYRIIINNLNTYLGIQINSLYKALQLPESRTEYAYQGEKKTELESFVYCQWIVGQNEIDETWLTAAWKNNNNRIILCTVVSNIIGIWRDLFVNSGLNPLLHAGVFIALFLLLAKELLFFAEGKEKIRDAFLYMFTPLVIIGECAALLLFLPEGRAAYLYPMLYAAYSVIYIYCVEKNCKYVKE